jgi:hypothetical protein
MSATAPRSAVAAESSPGEFSGLRFTRSGVVRRDMVFRSFPQACLYAETPTKWSTDWRRMGREPFPYLYRISPRKADIPADIVFEAANNTMPPGRRFRSIPKRAHRHHCLGSFPEPTAP